MYKTLVARWLSRCSQAASIALCKMVVLAASVCTKSGKPLISRQFRALPKSRIDGLLASFPKLIPAGSQHTTVENADVRFVYQPFEELYVLLITNKGSNILQDISTLSLIVRLISSLTPAMNEPAIIANSFELLCALDEVVTLGYKESVSLQQVRNVLEGESHEEKIQEIIARNKEAEAKEELKRRAKQLELQRREQQRLAQAGGRGMGGGAVGGYGGGFGQSQGNGSYASVPRFEPTPVERDVHRSSSPVTAPSKPAFKGSGMKLGRKSGKSSDLLDALGSEAVVPQEETVNAISTVSIEGTTAPAQSLHTAKVSATSVLPKVDRESIHLTIREHLSAVLSRDGGLQQLEVKGDLDLRISDASLTKIRLALAAPSERAADLGRDLQFQQHPNVAKFGANASSERVIALKDPKRGFPVNQGLGVLRWRLSTKDESMLPLSITCWPTPRGDGSCDVNVEYELQATHMTLQNVIIAIPLPHGGFPNVAEHTGDWAVNTDSNCLEWKIEAIDADSPTGTMEFHSSADDAGQFFPVQVDMVSAQSLCEISVVKVELVEAQENVAFSQETVLTVDQFSIV